MTAEVRPDEVGSLVRELYDSLASGDTRALARLLSPDFRGELSPGLPWGLGDHPFEGPDAMIVAGWGRVARELDIEPRPELIHVLDDRVAVLGTYTGRTRRGGEPFSAWFAHFWRVADGHVVWLRQVTDTAAWQAAVATAVDEGQGEG